MSLTYLRILANVLCEKIFPLALLSRIVTFYYNSFIFHPNIFKNFENMPINNTEHKNYMEYLKVVNGSDINLMY